MVYRPAFTHLTIASRNGRRTVRHADIHAHLGDSVEECTCGCAHAGRRAARYARRNANKKRVPWWQLSWGVGEGLRLAAFESVRVALCLPQASVGCACCRLTAPSNAPTLLGAMVKCAALLYIPELTIKIRYRHRYYRSAGRVPRCRPGRSTGPHMNARCCTSYCTAASTAWRVGAAQLPRRRSRVGAHARGACDRRRAARILPNAQKV
jgi:hypothetical protein